SNGHLEPSTIRRESYKVSSLKSQVSKREDAVSCRQVIITAVVVFGTLVRPQAQDNPQATSGSWRPTIVAQHGMVAAGHPLAAKAGMRILKAGGNAVDAAIATWAVQGEVEPG